MIYIFHTVWTLRGIKYNEEAKIIYLNVYAFRFAH